METHIFGIRHHGPGSARSLRAALETLEPDCILVEGPPDAEAILPFLGMADMEPPVALLLYNPDEPSNAVYYPFAVYSPEWQAIDYGLRRKAAVRFMDLPQTHRMAIEAARETPPECSAMPSQDGERPLPEAGTGANSDEDAHSAGVSAPAEAGPGLDPEAASAQSPGTDSGPGAGPADRQVRQDPLNWIAEAAGYSDGETWWEHQVEQRRSGTDVFQAVLEMMTALREAAPADPDPIEPLREAWMRQTIRAAQSEGFQRIAVVCGAWHAPALVVKAGAGPERTDAAKEDARLLKNLPKTRVTATWVPWTYGRLTYASGYGAGVTSPMWYETLWDCADRIPARWMIAVAGLLRAEDLPASPASVIEAVRLSEALAAVRERPLPGLPELWEAAQSIFCFGSDVPMRLILEKLIVGEKMGRVPAAAPMLPLQQDIRREQKRVRLEPEAAFSDKDFDLRKDLDRERSVLLHRLNLLGIPWGQVTQSGGGKGTFHELWRLQWQPEFEIKLIESNIFGNTVATAAAQFVAETSAKTDVLPELTGLVERTLLADLPEAIQKLMSRVENVSAVTSDLPHLMDALPALSRILRYGNVRETDVSSVGWVVDGLITRVCIGLPAACASLNDEAAAEMYPRLMGVHDAVRLLQNPEQSAMWNESLRRLADRAGLHGLIAGRSCRLLLDGHVWDAEEVGRRLNLALSPAGDPVQSAAWIDGLLRDSGDVLVHTDALWPILDGWVAQLSLELFPQILPLLRRTFSTFAAPLRRQLGERARSASAGKTRVRTENDIDQARAERTLPLLAQILGLPAR